jgi:hypothetical protein
MYVGFNLSLPFESLLVVSEVDADIFRINGIVATALRNLDHKNIELFNRKEVLKDLFNAILDVGNTEDKKSIICIPGGPGVGKSEIASRVIENCDLYISDFNKVSFKKIIGSWIACGVTFNFHSETTFIETNIVKHLGIETWYSVLISLRLIYIWFANKVDFPKFQNFVNTYSEYDILSQLKIIALPNVLQSIKNYSKSTNIILFIDESILPLDKLSDKERGRILSSLADLQSNDIHIVFTSLRQDTFESLTTPSGRKILQVVMNNLNLSDSVNLINNFVKILNGKKNIIHVNLNHNDLVHRDKQIKPWLCGLGEFLDYVNMLL